MTQPIRYLSVCSGMEAASVAWHHLGWKPVGFSEIEPFPCAILKHHFSKPNYPYDVPNYGSLTEFKSWPLATGDVDLLVGGTPCQSFSVAGKRGGLNDPRGQLMFSFLELAAKLQPKYVLWENVPGALSSGQPKGSDFGCLLQGLVERGYGVAYRILDAQHFGVPQRRRRVFVVAHRDPVTGTGDWRAAAEILSIAQGLRGYLAKGKQARKGSSADAESGAGADRKWPADTACTLNAAFGEKQGLEDQHALGGASLFVMSSGQANAAISKDVAHTLNATHETQTVAMPVCATGEKTHCLTASSGKGTTEDGTGRGTPIVIDRAAFNQGENAQYEPHIGESEVMDSLVARGPHAVGIPAMMFKIRGGSPVETGEQGGTPGKGAGKGFLGSEEKAFTIATSPDQWLAQPIISPTVTTCKGSRGGSSQEAIDEITAVHLAQQAIPIQDGREMEKNQNGIGVGNPGDHSYTLDTTGAQSVAVPFRKSKRACSSTDNETWVEANASNTLNNFDLGDTRTTHAVVQNVYENHPNDSRVTGPLDVAPKVVSRFGTGGGNVPLVNNEPKIVQASELRLRGQITEQSICPTLTAGAKQGDTDPLAVHAISFQPGNLARKAGADPSAETFPTLTKDSGDQSPHVAYPVVPLDGMNLLSRLGECGENHSMQNFEPGDPSFTLKKGGSQHGVLTPMAVRRLTPVECERLQGFPDNWSRISWKGKPEEECPDGPRYKACGNSMAVPVMRFIGEAIAAYEAKQKQG
jgi:DNA-cytosine methyltransferase